MKKLLSTTYKHIRRTPYQALAAISVLTLTFFLASVYFLVMAGSEMVLRYFETRPQVTIFFTDETTKEDASELQQKFNSNPHVAETKYISKEEALEIYREQNKEEPLLLEMVTADILPASLEISATDIRYLPEIAETVSLEESVEEVVFHRDVIEALSTWTSAIRISGISLLGFLSLVSIFIVLIIVSLKISARKVEIHILKLVGATNWYIIGPFILEGIIYGVLGAVFAWTATYTLLLYSTPFLISFIGEIPLLPVPLLFMLELLGGLVVAGSLFGGFASLVASRRFLR